MPVVMLSGLEREQLGQCYVQGLKRSASCRSIVPRAFIRWFPHPSFYHHKSFLCGRWSETSSVRVLHLTYITDLFSLIILCSDVVPKKIVIFSHRYSTAMLILCSTANARPSHETQGTRASNRELWRFCKSHSNPKKCKRSSETWVGHRQRRRPAC